MHRQLVYIYLLNVPSFSSRYFNKIKRTSRLGRLLALSLEILKQQYFKKSTPLHSPLHSMFYKMHTNASSSYKIISNGLHLFACLLRLSMGEFSFKKYHFFEKSILLFTVFYENQYLKEMSQLLKPKVCGFRDLLYPFL